MSGRKGSQCTGIKERERERGRERERWGEREDQKFSVHLLPINGERQMVILRRIEIATERKIAVDWSFFICINRYKGQRALELLIIFLNKHAFVHSVHYPRDQTCGGSRS